MKILKILLSLFIVYFNVLATCSANHIILGTLTTRRVRVFIQRFACDWSKPLLFSVADRSQECLVRLLINDRKNDTRPSATCDVTQRSMIEETQLGSCPKEHDTSRPMSRLFIVFLTPAVSNLVKRPQEPSTNWPQVSKLITASIIRAIRSQKIRRGEKLKSHGMKMSLSIYQDYEIP